MNMPIEVKGEKYYRLIELTELLGLHIATLRKKIKENRLKGKKIGREYIIREDALKDFLDGK